MTPESLPDSVKCKIREAIDATNNPPYFDKLPKWSEARNELIMRLERGLASEWPRTERGYTATPQEGITVTVEEPLLRPDAAKKFGQVAEALFREQFDATPTHSVEACAREKELLKEVVEELREDAKMMRSQMRPLAPATDNHRRELAAQRREEQANTVSAIIARHFQSP